MEKFTNQAVQIASFRFRESTSAGLDYVFSPIVIVLIIITVVSVVLGIRQAKSIMAEGDVKSGSKRAPFLFLCAILAYLVISYWNASLISDRLIGDKVVPMVIAGIAVACCLVLMVQMMRKPETDVIFADREMDGEDANAPHGLWSTLAWFAFLLALCGVFGFIIALAIFLVSFLRYRAGLTWLNAVIYSACGIAFMCFMAWSLNRDFPPGLLQSYASLPWPLR